jgi:hypothetical protein
MYFLDKAGVCTACTSTNSNIATCNATPLPTSCSNGFYVK